MKPATIYPENPFVKVQDDLVAIDYYGKKYKIALPDIAKMYLKKSKINGIAGLVTSLVYNYKRYKLYIRTEDQNEISIPLKAGERHHFVGLISYIRRKKQHGISAV